MKDPRLFGAVFISILSMPSLVGADSSTEHTHGGRIHTHPLPAQGIAHQHGNTAPGAYIQQQRPGTISGTLQQGGYTSAPTQVSPPPANTGSITAVQTPAAAIPAQLNLTKGKTDCQRSDPDCNVCAVNVRQQFNQAANGQINWRTVPWDFSWNKGYPPQQLRPLDIFDGEAKYMLGIPDKHVQGFVRTNSTRFPYAGSHSHKKRGGLFLLRQNQAGQTHLAFLHHTRSHHPSGVSVLGKFLVYGERGRVMLREIDKPNRRELAYKLPGPTPSFGGGVAFSKLADGTFLLITSGPGNQDKRPRSHRFYHLQKTKTRPRIRDIQYISEAPQDTPPQWPDMLNYMENLSLITECGSGDIYAVHTTGDQGINALIGSGYWRLSKLINRQGQPHLHPVSAFRSSQDMVNCSMRATATVHVTPERRLEFYCHGYAKDPKGSTLNVLGPKNRFYFKVGTPQ